MWHAEIKTWKDNWAKGATQHKFEATSTGRSAIEAGVQALMRLVKGIRERYPNREDR